MLDCTSNAFAPATTGTKVARSMIIIGAASPAGIGFSSCACSDAAQNVCAASGRTSANLVQNVRVMILLLLSLLAEGFDEVGIRRIDCGLGLVHDLGHSKELMRDARDIDQVYGHARRFHLLGKHLSL